MICPKCGNELTNVFKFCPKCGSYIKLDQDVQNISLNINDEQLEVKDKNIIQASEFSMWRPLIISIGAMFLFLLTDVLLWSLNYCYTIDKGIISYQFKKNTMALFTAKLIALCIPIIAGFMIDNISRIKKLLNIFYGSCIAATISFVYLHAIMFGYLPFPQTFLFYIVLIISFASTMVSTTYFYYFLHLFNTGKQRMFIFAAYVVIGDVFAASFCSLFSVLLINNSNLLGIIFFFCVPFIFFAYIGGCL